MQISFNLEYHGWLDIKVSNETNEYLIPSSFLTDVIYDIIQRLSSLIEGAPEAIIVIQTEPNENIVLEFNETVLIVYLKYLSLMTILISMKLTRAYPFLSPK